MNVNIFIVILQITSISSYTFNSTINNLLYVANTSTLYAISSSHLHQLHWSTSNQTLLVLHRRVQLHSILDRTEHGVSVFLYDSIRNLLILCSRSILGRCIFYDANDISHIYLLDSSLETNYLGCVEGCYTFLSSNVLRSALIGNRRERNGNILNSQIEFNKDRFHFNIKYQFQSSDNALVTSLTFLSDESTNNEYIYGFDYQDYTYYVLKSSRLARLCQASIAMRMSYEEIPLISCKTNSTMITNVYHSFEQNTDLLYVVYERTICVYTMNEIQRAFKASKVQCHAGVGYRLGFVMDSEVLQPKCEKVVEQNVIGQNECTWQPYRTNTYMNGTVGAIGDKIYENSDRIEFLFAQRHLIIIGTSQKDVLKFVRSNHSTMHLLHKAIYPNESLNHQYVIDYEYQTLIFSVGTQLHRYAYNSCSLYDTCQSCIGSRRYDTNPCSWSSGKCSFSTNPSVNDRGCPPLIEQIEPMSASVNAERVLLTITGSFETIDKNLVQVAIKFSRLSSHEFNCSIETIQNNTLTCYLPIPKQASEGIITIDIQSKRILSLGDTDISGRFEYPDKFRIYIPKPILIPAFGPAFGGTRIRITNLDFNFYSTVKIFLGKNECSLSRYDYSTDEIECINRACASDNERLELSVYVNEKPWKLEKTFFQCRANPIVFDWTPKKAILSGGIELVVTGQNFDVIQNPLMKSVYNTSVYEFISTCEVHSTSQMICLSPLINKDLQLNPIFQLNVSFIMDNMKIIPDRSNLTIVDDPVYYSFENSIQRMNSNYIIQIEGSNLNSTHSIDQIDIRIDNMSNVCTPFNFTETNLSCLLSKSFVQNLSNTQPNIEIFVGTNLTFVLGRIDFQNETPVLPLARQFNSWTTIILIVLSSLILVTLLFSLVILTRRRFYQASASFHKETKLPESYQSIWSQLGKTRQIDRKKLVLHEKIGQGCFGDVYRGELKQNDQKTLEVAVKILRDQNVSSMNDFLYEANRMKDFSHANILSLIGVTWDPVKKAMVILPYMKNGDLRSFISNEVNRPTVRQLITWAIQIADGMEYLASLKFVHRDLATRNCMLDEQLICRISDFGLSRDVVDRDYYVVQTTTKDKDGKLIQMTPRRLPIRWLSPESIESSKYTIQSDVWSFGVLLWELMSRGKTPYPGIDNADVYTHIKHGYRLQQPTYCPPLLFKSAMFVCWHVDPNQRPTFTQLAHDIRYILHQLELEQQRKLSSSIDDDDTTIIQRYPMDKKIKRLSSSTISSASSIGGQYITTPHRQSENIQLLYDQRNNDDDDAYAVAIHVNEDMFSTTRLLPEYTETSIAEDV